MRKPIYAGIILLLLFHAGTLLGQIKLPRLISDGMVLQQGAPTNIWGWASPMEAIAVEFAGSTYQTSANEAGEWKIALKPLPAGGPHQMVLKGKNTLTVSNILMGEVWVCSGQSNMELPMRRVVPLYGADIANAGNDLIRQFTVPQRYDFSTPQTDLPEGTWQAATPESVLGFSATAYFFALDIHQKYNVPIGLIHTSLGGSPAEAWMSESALGAFPNLLAEAKKFRDNALIQQIESDDKRRIQAWYDLLRQKDEGYKNPGQPWFDPAVDVSDWGKMNVPGYWTAGGNGVVWFRKEVQIPTGLAGLPAKLEVGRIVDADSVFLNGVFVGTTSYQYPPRWYTIPAGLLKSGSNSLVVRIINSSGKGGFVPDKPYELTIGNQKIDLKGEWRYRRGATMEPLASQTFIRWKPLGLFNAMIHPLLNYRIKGAIWYQGESNASRPQEYRRVFPAMINDWRSHWKQGDFPFLFVQLANFMEAKPQPVESNWALLREAQLKTLSLPNTGMAVAIDIGEWNDIHPLNKKDVGKRLALAAQAVAYRDKKTVFSGPVFKKMKIKGNEVILTFAKGSNLVSTTGKPLTGFAIAGSDGQFVWATASIKKNKIIVSNSSVPNPVAVRYAWADNPEGANLYNEAGLPASPFRTDDED
jgi:sialate O-acetylesterase